MTSTSTRFVTLALSTLVSGLLAWWAYDALTAGQEQGTAPLLEGDEQYLKLLEEQARGDVDVLAEDWPPLTIDAQAKAQFIERHVVQKEGFQVADPQAYYVRAPNIDRRRRFSEHPDGRYVRRTNSLGLRGDAEPRQERPGLRVIVTGDSHIEGVCGDDETLPAALGALLSAARPDSVVETLNAAVGGYGVFHYLGSLERLVWLEPDVFVVTVFGGNDFKSMQVLRRYYGKLGPYEQSKHRFKRLKQAGVDMSGLRPQELNQANYFLDNPGDLERAPETMIELTRMFTALCEEHGIELVFVYLPPALRGQPHLFTELNEDIVREFGEGEDVLASSDRIADDWIEHLEEEGVAYVDLRSTFGASEELYYWHTDHHINVAGHAAAAKAVQPVIEAIVAGD